MNDDDERCVCGANATLLMRFKGVALKVCVAHYEIAHKVLTEEIEAHAYREKDG